MPIPCLPSVPVLLRQVCSPFLRERFPLIIFCTFAAYSAISYSKRKTAGLILRFLSFTLFISLFRFLSVHFYL